MNKIAIVSPYPTRQNTDKLLDYIELTKNAANNKEDDYPIHLTELSVNDYVSKRRLYYRELFTEDNTAIHWVNVSDTLIVYDDFGIDDFMQVAIDIAKRRNINIIYGKCYN